MQQYWKNLYWGEMTDSGSYNLSITFPSCLYEVYNKNIN